MHEIALTNKSTQLPELPDNIPDLLAWDKYLSARMPVYRRLLKNVSTLEEAAEEETRIRKRASLESEYLIDVRVKIGKMIDEIPKASGGDRRSNDFKNDNAVDFEKTKSESLTELGISQKQAERYQKMANHPEAVEQAKADARERNDVVSQQSVMRQIAASTPPQTTVRQKKQEELHEAKERHKDFQEKKSNSVVDIQDIKQDKEDRKTIARDLYHDLLSITTKSYWIGVLNNSADFYALTEVIPEDMRASMADRVSKMIIVLNKLLEVIK